MNTPPNGLRALALTVVVAMGLVAVIGSSPGIPDWEGGGTTSVRVDPPPDNPPVYCNAGEDQTVGPDMLVELDGEGYDREGPVRPDWRQETGPVVQLSSTSTWNPTFTAPAVTQVTELRFRLRVLDSKGQVGSDGIDRVSIWVDPDYTPPPTVLIDFETYPNGLPTVPGDQVGDDYADYCVLVGTFDINDPSNGPIYRRLTPTQTVVWDLDRVFNPPPETPFDITLFFPVPVDRVSADVFALQGNRVLITAYDSNDGELGSAISPPAPPCCDVPAATLELEGLGPIHKARFNTEFPFSSFPVIDNVSLERSQHCGP